MTFGGQHGSFMRSNSKPVRSKDSEVRKEKTPSDKRLRAAAKVTPKL